MYSPRQKILWFALLSRSFLIIIQTLSNIIIPDHDAKVFQSPADPSLHESFADQCVNLLFGGLKRWDAQYFIHIAQYGYTYENCLAFFPLFPMCVRYLAFTLQLILGSILNIHSLLLLSAVLVNMLSFIKSADALHKLSLRVLRSDSKAYKAVILYCVNPASIFFIAPYSESMFAWMSFYTMYKCTENETLRFANIDLTSAVPASFAFITRSNGIVNLGFIIYANIKNMIQRTIPEIYNKYKSISNQLLTPFLILPLLVSLMCLALSLIISLIPFSFVQVYNYYKFCLPHEHSLPEFLINPEYIMPGTASSVWCNETLPLAYSYVQSNYWDVGFLKYYHFKQIPNFLLALPILSILLYHCFHYVKRNNRFCLYLGLININSETYLDKYGYRNRPVKTISSNEAALFVYVVHALFLTLFCIFFVHIQVSTRLLASSTPLFYWILADRLNIGPTLSSDQNTINEHFRRIGASKRIPPNHLTIANLEGVESMYSKWRVFIITKRMNDVTSRLIQMYFIGYVIIGTILFSNFLPWT